MSLPFLLEIGCEEIPDWMIAPALNNLQDMFQTLLDQQGLGGKVERVDATPRRLTLRAEGLAERQADTEELVTGPPKAAGPKAAAGFAKKQGVAVEALREAGNYYAHLRHTKGRLANTILAEMIPPLVWKIYFPKTMYWNGKGSERFIRPIRWVVALLGDEVVPFELAGVRSAAVTQGHRLLGRNRISITIEDYEHKLRQNGVILRFDERYSIIDRQSRELGARPDAGLARKLAYMTEHPQAIAGEFDPQYLELPEEVLVTVMRHHQNNFAVVDADGKLAAKFVAITNTDGDPEGLIRRGNERVLRARFNDARFFWGVDRKKSLEQRLPDLENVTFQAKLGSYLDKTNRTVALVEALGGDGDAQTAARLCKCDLTTDMVKEFPELQGVMGGLYARDEGHPEQVGRAIYEHYKPLSMEDAIPATPQGKIVTLADKLDTLRECFRIGLVPTGSRDPFALRRAAQGVVRILVEGKWPFHIQEDAALQEFFEDRARFYFRDTRGFKYDEVNACMAAGWTDLPDLESRLLRVQAIRPTADFEPLAASFKRVKNILKQADFQGGYAFRPELLEPGPERDLYTEIGRTAAQPLESRIASLRPRVDLFFDKVLVNAPDEALRRNRLTLLHNLLNEFSTIADFSEIVTGSNHG